jgi:hypothetical protein
MEVIEMNGLKKIILIVFLVAGISGIARADYTTDFYPVVNLIWDHGGDGRYLVDVKIRRDNGDIYQYQVGPLKRNYYRIDVDPEGLHHVSVFSGGGDLLYFKKFRHGDLPEMERFQERGIK